MGSVVTHTDEGSPTTTAADAGAGGLGGTGDVLDAAAAAMDAARDGAPPETGIAPVALKMRELRAAIDDFLTTQARRMDVAPDRTPPAQVGAPSSTAPATAPTAPPADHDEAGWEQAAAVHGDDDPQRSWIAANAAMRRGEHGKALELFETEADRAADADDHARAAIAYRMAADAATALGQRDRADHDLRRAGKHYLFVAESPANSLQTMFRSYLTASRCFLTVGNLELTQSCVSRALALQQTMNEDLHTRFNGFSRDPE